MTSISRVVNTQFVKNLARNGARQLQSSIQSGGGQQDRVSLGLRAGASGYARAIGRLNNIIDVVNVTRGRLQRILEITDEAIALAESSESPLTNDPKRVKLDRTFRKLGKEYAELQDIEFNEQNPLTKGGVKELLKIVGLDADTAGSIDTALDQFVTLEKDGELAPDEVKADRPIGVPVDPNTGNPIPTPEEVLSIFDKRAGVRTQSDGVRTKADLEEFRKIIETNIEGAEGLLQTIADNIGLLRVVGLAFLDASEQIGSDADAKKVAKDLQLAIRRSADRALLAQLDNLENLTVSSLFVSDEDAEIT